MKNQTDRFLPSIVFAVPDAVFTLLYSNSPFPIQWLSLVRESDTECWTCCSNWVCSYCNLCNSQKPGARCACFADKKTVVRGRFLV